MPELREREYRSLKPLERKEDDKKFDSECYVEGYAARYEPYVLYTDAEGNEIREEFVKGCFDDCDMSDIIMQYDHSGKVLARQRNNTLLVVPDEEGLFVAADLSKSEASRALYEEIENGLVDRMSWGFIPGEYKYDRKEHIIRHTKIKKIFDVSAVSMPANDTTNIHARSFVDGVIEADAQELREREETKEKLKLKLKLGGF